VSPCPTRSADEILAELVELLDNDPELRGRTLDWLGAATGGEEQADGAATGGEEASMPEGPLTGFIPLRRVAEELEINEQTLRQWIRDGKLTAYRIGKKVFVRPEDLAAVAEPWEPGEQIGRGGTPTPQLSAALVVPD